MDNEGVECDPKTVCPRCSGAGRVVHAGLTDALFDKPGRFTLRRCTAHDCGLGWIDPQPVPSELGQYYSDYQTHVGVVSDRYVDPHMSAGKRRLRRWLARLLFWRAPLMRSQLLFLEDLPPGRVLDVGCGSGGFLSAAAKLGWRAVGIDFDEEAVAAARGRGDGIEAHASDLAGSGFADASFDAIVLDNVIEHLPDPFEAFGHIARLLKPGGRLVMVTPNIDALGHELYGRDWRGLEPPRHLFLFSPDLLRRSARALGFRAARAFSYSASVAQPDGILDQSAGIARKSGRTPPALDHARIERREKWLDMIGQCRGEFAVLVAER